MLGVAPAAAIFTDEEASVSLPGHARRAVVLVPALARGAVRPRSRTPRRKGARIIRISSSFILDEEGTADLQALVDSGPLRKHGATMEEVMSIAHDEKGRFRILRVTSGPRVGAAAGWSMFPVRLLCMLRTGTCHNTRTIATSSRNIDSVRRSGLRPGGPPGSRAHVHLRMSATAAHRARPGQDSALVYSAPHLLASKLHLWCTENRYLVSPDTLPSDCLTSVLRGGTAKLLVPIAIARIARPSCKRSFVRIPIPLPEYIGFWMESLLLSSAPLGAVISYHPD